MPSIIAWTISSSIVLIAFSVWGLLMFYAHRSTLETEARKRFAIASGVYLLGWLVLAFVLGSAGVFQATPSRVFPAVGLAAPVVGYLFYKGARWSCLAVLSWNVAGILDLVVAVATGFLSSPGPFQVLALETPNELITAFPLVLVPVFAVPLSILLHLAALKRLKAVLGATSHKEFKCGGQPLRWASHPAAP